MKPSDLPQSLILMPSMMRVIRCYEPQLDALLATRSAFTYPDGSVQLDDADSVRQVSGLMTGALRREAEKPVYASPNSLLTGGTFFRSWAESPYRFYTIYLWEEFVHDLEDSNWVVVMGWDPASWQGIKNLACSEISVRFRRRADKIAMERFALMLGGIAGSKGIAGEGAISLIDTAVHFVGREARFRIDASATGQRTMNWFILALLHFASKVTITDIDVWSFSSADHRFGVPRGRSNWVEVPPLAPSTREAN